MNIEEAASHPDPPETLPALDVELWSLLADDGMHAWVPPVQLIFPSGRRGRGMVTYHRVECEAGVEYVRSDVLRERLHRD